MRVNSGRVFYIHLFIEHFSVIDVYFQGKFYRSRSTMPWLSTPIYVSNTVPTVLRGVTVLFRVFRARRFESVISKLSPRYTDILNYFKSKKRIPTEFGFVLFANVLHQKYRTYDLSLETPFLREVFSPQSLDS
jgi:hypothetical protein